MKPRVLSIALAGLAAAALQGCGPNGFAPDALVENPGANAFLNRVGKACGHLNLGAQPIGYILEPGSNDTFFVDEASKLYFGQVDQAKFAQDIDVFYPAGNNKKAVDCVVSQLPAH